ncbi:MAG: hypothetical protein KAX38_06045, partial [Candidatus Krumholzibacteria bacterium]|nr:hypothetical protein [Candidatus Krumholzibacteria bacterium]
ASDHRSFWDLGIPSVLLIEGKRFEYNPFYHSGNDVAAHLDYDFMASCTKAALGAAARLAGYRASGQDSVPSVVVELYQNHPNPFYESTVITFSLPGCCFVEVAVYDVKGQRVKLLKRGWMGPDEIDCPWDGSNDSGRKLASGVYFLRLKVGAVSEVRKIVILR